MTLLNGYTLTSTFWEDFSIADALGTEAVQDTYDKAFAEWKDNYVYLTELVIVLNLKIWQWYEEDTILAGLYNDLWEKTDEYACDNLTGEEASFFFRITD